MYTKKLKVFLFIWLALLARIAYADPTLIAIGTVSGLYEDFAEQTAGTLENGFPGNRLGGIGSGLAYAGGNTFLAVPDRVRMLLCINLWWIIQSRISIDSTRSSLVSHRVIRDRLCHSR